MNIKELLNNTKVIKVTIPPQSEIFLGSEENIDKIPTLMIGIYCLYNENKLVYIGKSESCLRQRLRTHFINRKNGYYINAAEQEQHLIDNFSYCIVDNPLYIEFIEKYLIKKCNPQLNVKK